MRKTIFFFAAWVGVATAAACSSDDNSPAATDAAAMESGSSGSSSGGKGGSSGSSSGVVTRDVGAPMQIGTAPGSVPGGINCGMSMMTQCPASQVCCWGDVTQMPAPLPGCTSASACTGSSLACSATAHCGAGQICCFAYMGGGGGGPFTATCTTPDQCTTGDMIHYQLCGSNSDCLGGGTCSTMAPNSAYCMGGGPVGEGGTGDSATGDGAPGDGAEKDGEASSGDAAATDAADAGGG